MESRIVVVTGHRGGIGSCVRERFESHGDVVVGLDLVDGVDLTDAATCNDVTEQIVQEHGRIDVLCNNAGIGAVGTVCDATPDEWQRVFQINVFAVAYLSRSVILQMRKQESGVIVNTCSVVANIGLVDRAVYGASKGAVRALTLAMAADEIRHGIRVNCVSPATVDGPWVRRLIDASDDPSAALRALQKRQPLGQMVQPEDVAEVVFHLSRSDSAITGFDYRLDAGMTTVSHTGN